ncbi:MAG: phosphoglycerate kinase [Candidatus Komeilibacteria bacterium]
MKEITQLKNLKNKTVLVRVDFNVAISKGKVLDDAKMQYSFRTINYLLKKKARVIMISHLGRPQARVVKDLSLAPIAKHFSNLIKHKVDFVKTIEQAKASQSDLILLENIRFFPREHLNCKRWAKQLASLGDYYVFEAFASHRQESSVNAIADYLPSYAGFRFLEEIVNLKSITTKKSGSILILGGAKAETKIKIIKNLINQYDYILLGGVMANTFLKAFDFEIGKSIYDEKSISACKKLISAKILLPIDVVVKTKSGRKTKPVYAVEKGDYIYDLGPQTLEYYKEIIKSAKQIVFNGPMGYYEQFAWQRGSNEIALAIAASHAKKIAGGGETVDLINDLNIAQHFSFISTGGGAMLKYLEDGKLPIFDKLK